MPMKRRNTKAKEWRITPEAVKAWQVDDWMGLHRALGLRPWQPSPLDAETPTPPENTGGSGWADFWPLAFDLRAKLEAASRATG